MKKITSLMLVISMLLAIVPLSVFSVAAETLTDEQGLSYTLSDDGTYYIVSDFDETVTVVTIPSEYNGLPVREIGDSAFGWCYSLAGITIPDSVTTIGNSAFHWCEGLTSVTIPNSVTTIGEYAFAYCNIININFGSSVTTIGNSAFRSCYNLKDIFFPKSLTSIGNWAFSGCSFESVTIPDSVTTIGSYAFESCYKLTTIEIPNSVRNIGNSAFEDCYNLEFYEYENGLYLGNVQNPYYAIVDINSERVTSISLSGSTKVIAAQVFSECDGMVSINIPDSVIAIGDYAFSNCGLTTVKIPKAVTTIGIGAFSGCKNITSMIVAEENTYFHIANNCLIETATKTLVFGCNSSIIPDDGSVTAIGASAFRGCSQLTQIEIPRCITSIGDYAFYDCASLTEITIPFLVDEVGSYMFSNCTSLTNIYCEFDRKPVYWDSNWLSNCSAEVSWIGISEDTETFIDEQGVVYKFSEDSHDDGSHNGAYYFVTDYTGNETEIEILSECNGLPVTIIGTAAFEFCDLTKVVIPNSVTSIYSYAFYSSQLTEITIPDSVTYIGERAFSQCEQLTTVVLPDSVTEIPNYLFYRCPSLTNVTMPDSLEIIGEFAFAYCYGLSDISIPASVKAINDYAFLECTGFKNIEIPGIVETIGAGAFSGCTNAASITVSRGNPNYHSQNNCLIETETKTLISGCNSSVIPADGSVTVIGESAFSDCSAMESIAIPDTITTIEFQAFWNCSGLTNIEIPDSVTVIESQAFVYCSGLKRIHIPSSVASIGGGAFAACSGLESITVDSANEKYHSNGNCLINTEFKVLIAGCKNSVIPSDGSVTGIYDAFYGCTDLNKIDIPDTVTDIGENAFRGCSNLSNVTIPESVTYIGNNAFSGCNSFTYIVIPDTVKYMYSDVFSGCDNLSDIYCVSEAQPEGWGWWSDNCAAEIHWGYDGSEIVYTKVVYNIDDDVNVTFEDNNAFEGGTVVAVKALEINDIHESVTKLFGKLIGFDFTAMKDGKPVQPKEKVKVNFAIPEGFSNNVSVYYVSKDGKMEKTSAAVDSENRKITAELEHFSIYVLVDNESKNENGTTGDINDNGEIDSLDYILLKRAYFGTFQLSDTAKSAGDINGNGEIDSLDYILLKRAYFGTYKIK